MPRRSGCTRSATSQFGGDEPHYLLTAESIVSDHDVDLRDEYAAARLSRLVPVRPRAPRPADERAGQRAARASASRCSSPPRTRIGGPLAVQLLMAAIAALAFTLGGALARRVVPGAVGDARRRSPAASRRRPSPTRRPSTPELTAGRAAGVRRDPRAARARPAADPLGRGRGDRARDPAVARARVRDPRERRRAGDGALAAPPGAELRGARDALEVVLFSAVLFVTINDQLFGGFTPTAADVPGRAVDDLGARGPRRPRAAARRRCGSTATYGLLRWAPVFALAFFALWLLWRSRRDRLARALPEQRDVEVTATLCALVCGAQVVVAAFLAPAMSGFWFPGPLPRLRRCRSRSRSCVGPAPRAARRRGARRGHGVTSIWWYAELRIDGGAIVGPSSRAPLGPLDVVLPLFAPGSVGRRGRAGARGGRARRARRLGVAGVAGHADLTVAPRRYRVSAVRVLPGLGPRVAGLRRRRARRRLAARRRARSRRLRGDRLGRCRGLAPRAGGLGGRLARCGGRSPRDAGFGVAVVPCEPAAGAARRARPFARAGARRPALARGLRAAGARGGRAAAGRARRRRRGRRGRPGVLPGVAGAGPG